MISVVVPAFNEGKIINKTLESLLKQDFRGEYEIIVVDNGSRDNTAEAALAMGVRVVNCPQKGVSYARQAGANAAKGKYIVQADADSIYPEWWLGRIASQFERHRRAVAVAGTFIYSDPPWWAFLEYFLRSFFGYLSTWVMRRPMIISGANFAYKKSALKQIGGYHPTAYSSDQIDISARLRKVGPIVYDGRSYCYTSNRSVAKPLTGIIAAFVQNLYRYARHVSQETQSKPVSDRVKRSSYYGNTLKVLIPALVILISVLCYGYFVPASPVFGKVSTHLHTTDKVIALTFDDGPNEPYTSKILDILEKYDVNATFFLVGANVEKYPETARRILADNDVIGNHSYSHNANHALKLNPERDIALAQMAIIKVTGVAPHLYRPPHGKKSPWELSEVGQAGFIEVLWNVSTGELNGATPTIRAEQIIAKSRPGGIILLHDGYGTLHDFGRADKSATVEMLPLVIEGLTAKGYTFVTVPELLNVPAYNTVVK